MTVTADAAAALSCDGLVVPGVGAFAACMTGLRAIRGEAIIGKRLAAGRPVLGICVGMQVLFAEGVEHGQRTAGCGVLPGVVERLDAPVLPHMGWNTVRPPAGTRLLAGIDPETRFYFVHSYAARSLPPRPGAPAPAAGGQPLLTLADARAGLHRGDRGRPAVRHPVPPGEVGGRRRGAAGQLAGVAPMTLTLLPAVDVSGGQAVRLVQGAAGTETGYGDPLDGRTGLAAGRRPVDSPGRPRRRLRPRLERAAAGGPDREAGHRGGAVRRHP